MKGTSRKERFSRMIVWLATIVFFMACNSQSDKPYSIAMQGNNLYITMPHPTIGVVGINQVDWRGVNISEVVEYVFQKLQECDLNGDCALYVRFETSTTDKYGNETSSYDENFIVSIPISEAKKYKDAKHLDGNYSISRRIEELAFPKQESTNSNEQGKNDDDFWKNVSSINNEVSYNGLARNNMVETDTTFAMVTFFPQNATIVDEQGRHNFEHFDCPNMEVGDDNGKRVHISWGGDEVVLYKSPNNADTYTATGHTSRGNVTLRAFRSSSSRQIYLVTAIMPNPTTDVKLITINFKH